MINYKMKCFLLIFCSFFMMTAFFCVSYLKIAYPMGYKCEIREACAEFGVDENLVRAIVNVESGYDELAVSRVGARGLMQIMPETAKYISSELGIDEFSEEMLFNPKLNIRMGVFYLKYLFEKYNNLELVLFAYNAGEGRLNDYLKKEDALQVENIEIIETRNYIKNVKKKMQCYTRYEILVETVLYRTVF